MQQQYLSSDDEQRSTVALLRNQRLNAHTSNQLLYNFQLHVLHALEVVAIA